MPRTARLVLIALGALGAALLALGWWLRPLPQPVGDPDPNEPIVHDPLAPPRGARGGGWALAPLRLFDSEPGWDIAIDDRVAALIAEHGGLFRLECVPDPADFDAPHPLDLVDPRRLTLPWIALPGGAMRVESSSRAGFEVSRAQADTPVLLRWNVDETPNCRISPLPTRRFSLDIDLEAEPEDLELQLCAPPNIPVAPGQRVEGELTGGSHAVTHERTVACVIQLLAGQQLIASATVDMLAPGAAHVSLVPVAPADAPAPPSPPSRESWERQIADALAHRGSAFEVFDQRIAALEHALRSDPSLAPHLLPRIAHQQALKEGYAEHVIRMSQEAIGRLDGGDGRGDAAR
jgi:hypothetical protein